MIITPLSDTPLLCKFTASLGRAEGTFLVLSYRRKDKVLCKTDFTHHICGNQPKIKAHEIYSNIAYKL